MLFIQKKYELRGYQKEAVSRWVEAIKKWIKWIIVLPTWSGKSLVIANIANQIEGKTIVFQPSKEILEQNFQKYLSYSDDDDVSIYSASIWQKSFGKVVFATIWSVINNMHRFSEYANVIIDECHLVNPKWGMYKDFLNFLDHSKVIGLTATPYRLASNSLWAELRFITRTRPRIFTEVLYYSQVWDLREHWFLSPMKYFQVKWFDSNKLQSNSTWAEYSEASIKQHFKEIHFDNSLLDTVKRLVNSWRKSILVFTSFISESEYLVKELGTIARTVSSNTHKRERTNVLESFKEGKIKVVANVWVLTTGFDFPELECVVLARPTKSLWLYYQMVGRWIRPHVNKDECRVIDMCENHNRFWKVEDLFLMDLWNWKRVVKSWNRQLTNTFFN